MIVINDTHLGVNRAGGTTAVTFAALSAYTHEQFEGLLKKCQELKDKALLINGDLLDQFLVPNATLLRTYNALAAAISGGVIEELYLARGNHDYHPSGDKLSSFNLLGELLTDTYPNNVFVINEPQIIETSGFTATVLPHAPNQDIFNLWVKEVVGDPQPYLFVHANYDNGFAAESDHSLNMSAEQCAELRQAGVKRIIFAHEHQQAEKPDGVLIVGNQFPTSVSDCLGNDFKRALQIEGDTITQFETWTKAGSYFECDWKQLDKVPEKAQFVRVKGEASAQEASDVLDRVSRLRKLHGAFVITNAVVVDGRALDVTALEAVEEVKLFDVQEYLLQNLDNDAQRDRVRHLLKEKKNAQ